MESISIYSSFPAVRARGREEKFSWKKKLIKLRISQHTAREWIAFKFLWSPHRLKPPCFECFERFGKQKIHILLLLCRAIFACLVKYVSSFVLNSFEEGTKFLINRHKITHLENFWNIPCMRNLSTQISIHRLTNRWLIRIIKIITIIQT